MATTTTATALTSTNFVSVPGSTSTYGFEKTCPTCGQPPDAVHPHHPAELTRRRVKDLEGQVQMLNSQAAQMAEKLAEYEDEVQRLRARSSNQPARTSFPRNTSFVSATSTTSTSAASHAHSNSNPTSNSNLNPQSQSPPPQQAQQSQSRLSSLASLLPLRRPSTASQPRPSSSQTTTSSPPHSQSAPPAQFQSYPEPPRTPTPRPSTSVSTEETAELQNALTREQSLRKAAETQLTQASSELEELTAQLFSQANEMVAQERKARARLEERVAVLERRDVEKRTRLERLEKAMERVERIRALVG